MNLQKGTTMKFLPILSILLAVALLGSCKSSTSTGESNAVTGTFKGNVALVDARGDTLPNYSGATVSIEGTSFQATSNDTGEWEIDNVPAGVYNLILTKPGFDTLVIPQYEFTGVGTSFVLSSGIQALPMDSLVFTVSCFLEDSTSSEYLILLTVDGGVSGPDSLFLSNGTMVASGVIDQSPGITIADGQISGAKGAIGRSLLPSQRGGVETFQGYLYANPPNVKFTYFQGATSPYIVVRTFRLP
jgi:hypothetical protein